MDEDVKKWVKKKMQDIDALKSDIKTLDEMKAQAPTETTQPTEEKISLAAEEQTSETIEEKPFVEMPNASESSFQTDQPVLSAPVETPAAEETEAPPTLSLTETQFSTMKSQYPPKHSLISKKVKFLIGINVALIAAFLLLYFFIIPMLTPTV
jgi:ribosome-binding ATPase YchF (GTP1/OBG family)